MKIVTVFVLGLFLPTVAAEEAKEKATKEEQKKLQGTWTLVSQERNGRRGEVAIEIKLTIKDDLWTIGSFTKRTCRLDPSTTPKSYDIIQKREGEKDVAWLGIYKLDGDALTVCYFSGKVGATERPKEFKTTDPPATLEVYKRAKK